MQQCYSWLHEMKKKDEEKRKEEEHQQLVVSAEGSGLLRKITQPTAWRGGVQVLEEEDVRSRGKRGQSTASVTRGEKPRGQTVEEPGSDMFGGRAPGVKLRRSKKRQRGVARQQRVWDVMDFTPKFR